MPVSLCSGHEDERRDRHGATHWGEPRAVNGLGRSRGSWSILRRPDAYRQAAGSLYPRERTRTSSTSLAHRVRSAHSHLETKD